MRFLSLFILIALISCAPAKTSQERYTSRTYQSQTTKGNYYIVKKGDSLWRISKRYGVSVSAIMKVNGISSAQNLKVGQKLIIPRTSRVKTSTSFLWPVKGEVVNFFGETVDSSPNRGLNIKANPTSKRVSASAQGRVVFSDNLKTWGRTVILEHGSDYYTIYANLDNTNLREGDLAKKGQSIGEVASGKNGNYILHFEIRKNYIPQDPLKYIN